MRPRRGMDQSQRKDQSDPGRDRGTGTAHDRIVDELRLLLDAVAQCAEEYLGGRAEATAECRDAPPASCGWCPLCAVVTLLRGQRPDVRFVEQLAAAVTLLRQSLAEPYEEPPQPDPPERAPDFKVQRINVRRVDGRILREQATAGKGPGC